MNVLLFTIFVSLALAVFFVGAFLYHHDFSGGDPLRDSLLPFRRETARRRTAPAEAPKKSGCGGGGKCGKGPHPCPRASACCSKTGAAKTTQPASSPLHHS